MSETKGTPIYIKLVIQIHPRKPSKFSPIISVVRSNFLTGQYLITEFSRDLISYFTFLLKSLGIGLVMELFTFSCFFSSLQIILETKYIYFHQLTTHNKINRAFIQVPRGCKNNKSKTGTAHHHPYTLMPNNLRNSAKDSFLTV